MDARNRPETFVPGRGWTLRYPAAQTPIRPGVEKSRRGLRFDGLLGDAPPAGWADEIALAHVTGNRIITEVLFLHRAARTQVMTDLIELTRDVTEGVDRVLRFWWKWVTFMWNKPRPAPEYRLGWRDRRAAAKVLRRVLDWQFDRIALAHGDLVGSGRKTVAREDRAGILERG